MVSTASNNLSTSARHPGVYYGSVLLCTLLIYTRKEHMFSFVRGDCMNHTEQYIQQFYQYIKINDPLLLSKELIVECLNIKLSYWPHSSAIATHKGRYIIFLNDQLSMQQQWQDFGHEMYHYCHDHVVYDRLHESYAQYGESKADYFAYHFCVPTFMLLNLKEVSVDVIARLFNVECDFALRRFEMYQNKMLIGGVYQHG